MDRRRPAGAAAALGGGRAALVTVGSRLFGKVHERQFFSISVAGYSSGTAVKAWAATVAVTLGSSSWRRLSRCTYYLRRQGTGVDRRRPRGSGRPPVPASVPVACAAVRLGFQDNRQAGVVPLAVRKLPGRRLRDEDDPADPQGPSGMGVPIVCALFFFGFAIPG